MVFEALVGQTFRAGGIGVERGERDVGWRDEGAVRRVCGRVGVEGIGIGVDWRCFDIGGAVTEVAIKAIEDGVFVADFRRERIRGY